MTDRLQEPDNLGQTLPDETDETVNPHAELPLETELAPDSLEADQTGDSVEQPVDFSAPDESPPLHDGPALPGGELDNSAVYEPFFSMIENVRYQADHDRLCTQFGGAEKWSHLQGELSAWGENNLPAPLFQELSQSYDGVLALYRMAFPGTPEPALSRPGQSEYITDEASLRRMIRDPRYWRDRDSAFIAEVQSGYAKLYGP